MKVYIAGKITGLPEVEVYAKFYRSERALQKTGHLTMSPAVLMLNEGFAHEDYMHVCFAMIDVCDAVYMQGDWEDSRGARLEMQYAKERKKQVIFEAARG